MTSKKLFTQHLIWNLYEPKNFKFCFLEKVNKKEISKPDWESLFYFIVDFLLKRCTINLDKKNYNCKKIEFHKRYGWVLSNNTIYAFLGKLDVSDTRANISIGRNSYISGSSLISGYGFLNIGSFTCIGENFRAVIENDQHSFTKVGFINFVNNRRLSYEGLNFGSQSKSLPGKINIGNNCWIGRNVILKNNVYIENGVCVGESSLVLSKQNLNSNCLYVGVPAMKKKELLKKSFDLKNWWQWSRTKILKNKRKFL